MITLYGFGPMFGLPDPSPYVMKTEVQLKMAGLGYLKLPGDLDAAPKRKLPVIDDDGFVVADSAFIRWHIEQKYGVDFDEGLDTRERALAWAAERMAEDHLGWALGYARWLMPENFDKGPARFFDDLPEPARSQAQAETRDAVRGAMEAHGIARHSLCEITRLADRSLCSLSTLLGDKTYLMGERPCGADAVVFAMTAGALCPHFDSPIRQAAERYGELVAYSERMMRLFFPAYTAAAQEAA
ncbi:glutathione S-transferase family protein [Phenylobacterium sp.]|uniref:glutathione S-transferase family protein n=1 Tax=Phenylobacterium sp. TaxID=1871053 RepID=UPI001991BAA8|nr:glutathione S-transferase family protein [Phenylobacterium sp.]MBC7167256.1 glutathione S-transferase family protein [Phenylobacterium sp.]